VSEAKKDLVVFVIVLFLMCVNVPLQAADWIFQEIIVDDNPPQLSRITDCTIVDINGDGKIGIYDNFLATNE